MGWYHTEHPLHSDHFLICFTPPSEFYHSCFIHQSSGKYQQTHLLANQENWQWILLIRYHFDTLQGPLTRCKILHGAGGFNFPLKEVVLQIFIAFKNPLSSVGFQPVSLESKGKHNNHQGQYITLHFTLNLIISQFNPVNHFMLQTLSCDVVDI
jgi:hypothetical protein